MDTDRHRWGKVSRLVAMLMLALLLVGTSYAQSGKGKQGKVELSFEGYKWEKGSFGDYLILTVKFRLKNNSSEPISFLGVHKSFLEVEIMKADSAEALNPLIRCGFAVDWCVIQPGEEVVGEAFMGEEEVPWQAEFRYVPGLVSTWQMGKEPRPVGNIKFAEQIKKSDWVAVRSATALPIKNKSSKPEGK